MWYHRQYVKGDCSVSASHCYLVSPKGPCAEDLGQLNSLRNISVDLVGRFVEVMPTLTHAGTLSPPASR